MIRKAKQTNQKIYKNDTTFMFAIYLFRFFHQSYYIGKKIDDSDGAKMKKIN